MSKISLNDRQDRIIFTQAEDKNTHQYTVEIRTDLANTLANRQLIHELGGIPLNNI